MDITRKKKSTALSTAEFVREVKVPRDHPRKQQDRQKKLDRLIRHVQAKLKVEPINLHKEAKPIGYFSTGLQEIDDALSGCRSKEDATVVVPGSGKGFPRGRIVEIYGPEAAAKTSLSLLTIGQAQRNGYACAFIDAEHALDLDFAKNILGVDTGNLAIYEPDSGNEGLETLKQCVQAGFDIVVVDSVAALVPREELAGKSGLGAQARLMSQTCRELTSYLKKGAGTLVIFINQIRYKIGIAFGNPETTTGGNALKYYASMRVVVRKKKDLKKQTSIKGEPAIIGRRIKLYVEKSKVGPAHGICLFDIFYNSGIKPVRLHNGRPKDDG